MRATSILTAAFAGSAAAGKGTSESESNKYPHRRLRGVVGGGRRVGWPSLRAAQCLQQAARQSSSFLGLFETFQGSLGFSRALLDFPGLFRIALVILDFPGLF